MDIPREAWPAIAESLAKPWPAEAIALDLVWWGEDRPGRAQLAVRWGVTDWEVKKALGRVPPAFRQTSASVPPATRQSEYGTTSGIEKNPPDFRQRSASVPPADRQQGVSGPPAPTSGGGAPSTYARARVVDLIVHTADSTSTPEPPPSNSYLSNNTIKHSAVLEANALLPGDRLPAHVSGADGINVALDLAEAAGVTLVPYDHRAIRASGFSPEELELVWAWAHRSQDGEARVARESGWADQWRTLLNHNRDGRLERARRWHEAGRPAHAPRKGPVPSHLLPLGQPAASTSPASTSAPTPWGELAGRDFDQADDLLRRAAELGLAGDEADRWCDEQAAAILARS